jgi:two-component system invasion response regulator UvrY
VTLLQHDSEPLLAPADTLSVVVVDPHAPVREGLPLLLAPEGIDVLGVSSTSSHAERLIERHQPDVVLVALVLSDGDGLGLLRKLVRRGARSAVVLYSAEENGDAAAVAMHAGAAGVIAKRRTIAELAEALRVVAGGGLWFNEISELPPEPAAPPEPIPGQERRTAALSGSELRVLALVADGRSTEEAADALSLSPHTVRTHLRNVMRKLHASSRAHAVAIAMREAAIDMYRP